MERFLEKIASVWRPHEGQREFLLAKAFTKVLACGRRWGKTDACAAEVAAKMEEGPPSRQFLIAPTLDQARILFDRVVDLLDRLAEVLDWPLPKVRLAPYPRLTLGEHVVLARSAHRPRSLRGYEATHIVVDEAAFVPGEVLHDVLAPMLATTGGTMTLISTPNGLNLFWRYFQRGQRGEADTWSRTGPSAENPLVRREFLEAQRSVVSERTFAVEYEANFVEAQGAVFRAEEIEAALVPDLGETQGPIHIGVDWARYHDYTVVAVLQGTMDDVALLEVERFNLAGFRQVVEKVAEIVRRYPGARIAVDQTGSGDVYLDGLRECLPGWSVGGHVFTPALKSALIERLAGLFDRRAIRMLANPVIQDELANFVAVESRSGHMRLEARCGHDDIVVAIALAAYGLTRSRSLIRFGRPRVF